MTKVLSTGAATMAPKVVGVGDCAISANADETITTYALGSCIAVTMHDPVAKVGGLLHFLLPERSAETGRGRNSPFAYAETGVPELLAGCLRLGAEKRRLRVYAAGGASVLEDTGFFEIGRRNHLSLRKVLWKAGLLVQAEAIGGTGWRNVRLHIGTGKVWVKEGARPEIELSAAVRRTTTSEP